MASLLRRVVSKQKRRFTQEGFDLDLAYISPRVIAMGLPAAHGTEVLYRNPMAEVARFVRAYHPGGRAKVFNLCSEHVYSAELLPGAQLVHQPFDDHQVPSLATVQQLIVDAAAWLAGRPDNIVVIHCKAGKGRTGVMVCCLLLYLLHVGAPQLANLQQQQQQQPQQQQQLGPGGAAQAQWHPWSEVQPVLLEQLAEPWSDVLALYAQRRTIDGNGVTISSQRRWVFYFWSTLAAGPPPLGALPLVTLPPPRRIQLRQVTISGLARGTADSCELVIEARPSGSTAPRASLVCVRAAGGGGGSSSSSMPGLCGVPCCARPPLVQDGSCRISSGPDGDSLTFTIPAASQGLQALRAAGTHVTADEAGCSDEAAEGGSCVVEGDVRLTVTRGGARLFYTWFHTAFLQPGSGSHMLTRAQLDKPHKALPQQLCLAVRHVDSQPVAVQLDGTQQQDEAQQQLWAQCSEGGIWQQQQQSPTQGTFSHPQPVAAAVVGAGGAGMAVPSSASAPASPQARKLRSSNSWRQCLPLASSLSASGVLLGAGSDDAAAAGGGHTDAWAALVGGKAAASAVPQDARSRPPPPTTAFNWDWLDSLSSAGAAEELIGSTPACSGGGGGGSIAWRPAHQSSSSSSAATSKQQLGALLLPPPQQQEQQEYQGAQRYRRHSSGLDDSECSGRHSVPGAAAIELQAVCRGRANSSTLAALLDPGEEPTPPAGSNRMLKKVNSWSGAHGWFGAAAAAAAAVPAAGGGRRSATPTSQAAAVRRTRTQPLSGAGGEGDGDDVRSSRDVFAEDCLAPLLHVCPGAAAAAALPPAALAACDPLCSLLEALEWGADAPQQRWQPQHQPDRAGGSSRMRSAPCSPAHGSSRRGGKGLPPVASSPVLHQPPAASSAPAMPAAVTWLSSPSSCNTRDQGLHRGARLLQSPVTSAWSAGRPTWAAAGRLGGCAEEEGEQDDAAAADSAGGSVGPVLGDAAAAADEFCGRAAVPGVRRRSSAPGTSVQRGGRRGSHDELRQGLLSDCGGGADDGGSGLLQPCASAPVGPPCAGGSEAPAALVQWQHLEKAWERSWWVVF